MAIERSRVTNFTEGFSLHADKLVGDISQRAAAIDQSIIEITAEDLLNRKVESTPCLIEPIFHRVRLAAVAGSHSTP